MSAKEPRAAYCTGCGVTFPKMHLMINHRRMKRCGGRFLDPLERARLDALRLVREKRIRDEGTEFKQVRYLLRVGDFDVT